MRSFLGIAFVIPVKRALQVPSRIMSLCHASVRRASAGGSRRVSVTSTSAAPTEPIGAGKQAPAAASVFLPSLSNRFLLEPSRP